MDMDTDGAAAWEWVCGGMINCSRASIEEISDACPADFTYYCVISIS